MTTPTDLDIRDITVRFGGLVAVNAVSIHAEAGVVTGLIGPNGAGKSTILNACAGLVDVEHGSVSLGPVSLDRKAPYARAQRGLGRTFQRMELLESMDVRANVAIGPEAMMAGRHPWHQLLASRTQRDDIRARTDEALDRCDLTDLATRRVSELSTGQRRRVELARAISSPFQFVLLDEPSSGLDHEESEDFGRILMDIVATRGTGILLVEHDMTLIRAVCRYVYLLEFGRLIYEGETAQVLRSDQARAAYLGSEGVP